MNLRPIVFLALLGCSLALAQSGGDYEVWGAAPAAGGGPMAGGDYAAEVSMGQVGAAEQPSSGGGWSMDSGLMAAQAGTEGAPELIFAHGFED